MFYKAVMVMGVFSIAHSVFWFYRLFTGQILIGGAEIAPMVVGGIAGGIGAWYLVPWLFKYEAERRRAAKSCGSKGEAA